MENKTSKVSRTDFSMKPDTFWTKQNKTISGMNWVSLCSLHCIGGGGGGGRNIESVNIESIL